MPAPRPVSLKNDSIAIIQSRHPKAIITSAAMDTNKGSVAHLKPKHEDIVNAHTPITPVAVIFPEYSHGEELSAPCMDPAEAMVFMAEQGFNYHILGENGFERLSQLLDGCLCFSLTYSSLDEAILWFEQLSNENEWGKSSDAPNL